MTEQKEFDIVGYILEKNSIQGEAILDEFYGLESVFGILEYKYEMYAPVMVNKTWVHEGDLSFEYNTITDGERFLYIPYSISIKDEKLQEKDYIIFCENINKKINKNAEKHLDDVIIILDKKVILIENWYYEDEYCFECSTKVIELGTLTESDWNKLQVLGKAKTVITEPEEQKVYRRICENNKNAGKE